MSGFKRGKKKHLIAAAADAQLIPHNRRFKVRKDAPMWAGREVVRTTDARCTNNDKDSVAFIIAAPSATEHWEYRYFGVHELAPGVTHDL